MFDQRLYRAVAYAIALSAALMGTALAASARPVVALRLQGVVVAHAADGAETVTPIDTAGLQPGETVRYLLTATNRGAEKAFDLKPIVKIPDGTAYEAGTATTASRPEFSLDGGKTWSAAPTIKVKTPAGIVEKKADPATFTAIRWTLDRPLDPQASTTYSYQVHIK